jgi:hypothetical protein
MNTATYYAHARSLAPFRAADALALAREAAALDQAAADKARVPYVDVSHEDGIRMAVTVRVY